MFKENLKKKYREEFDKKFVRISDYNGEELFKQIPLTKEIKSHQDTLIDEVVKETLAEAEKDKSLAQAEAQLLGFCHARSGYSLGSLIDSMGLSMDEWKKLSKSYELTYLTDDDFQEIKDKLNQLKG